MINSPNNIIAFFQFSSPVPGSVTLAAAPRVNIAAKQVRSKNFNLMFSKFNGLDHTH
jgi:hypothetical protein